MKWRRHKHGPACHAKALICNIVWSLHLQQPLAIFYIFHVRILLDYFSLKKTCTANSLAITNQTFPSLSSKVVLQNLGGSPCMMTLMKIGTCAAWILEMPWIRGTLRVNRVHLKIDREKGQRLLCCELFFGRLLIRYVRSLTDYWKSDRFKVWPSFLFRPPPALFYNSRKHAVFLFLGQVKFP